MQSFCLVVAVLALSSDNARPICKMQNGNGAVTALCFDKDSKLLVTGSSSGNIKICRGPFGGDVTEVALIKAHQAPVTILTVGSPRDHIASSDGGKFMRIWDLKTGKMIKELPFEAVSAASYLMNGTLLAVGRENGHVTILDTASYTPASEWRSKGGEVVAVQSSPSGLRIGIASEDGNVRIYESKTQKLVYVAKSGAGRALYVAFIKESEILSSGSAPTVIRVVDWQSDEQVRSFSTAPQFFAGSMSTDRRVSTVVIRLCGPAQSGHVQTPFVAGYDVASGRRLFQVIGTGTLIFSVAVSPDRSLLACGGKGGEITVWRMEKLVEGGR